MDIQTILVYIIVLLCVVYAGRHFLKFFKKKKPGQQSDCGCGCGCAGCPKEKHGKTHR